jgi:hypothetical protein
VEAEAILANLRNPVQPKGESRPKNQRQIEKQQGVQQCRRIATERHPNIQMILPLAKIGFALLKRARRSREQIEPHPREIDSDFARLA